MYKKKYSGWLKHADFLILDIIVLQLSFYVAYCIRHGIGNMYADQLYAGMAIVLLLIDIVIGIIFENLHNVMKRGFWIEAIQTSKQVLEVFALFGFINNGYIYCSSNDSQDNGDNNRKHLDFQKYSILACNNALRSDYYLDYKEITVWKVFSKNLNGSVYRVKFATVYKGNIIKNLIMDCQSYTKYRPNETTGGIFVSWRRKEELPTGA